MNSKRYGLAFLLFLHAPSAIQAEAAPDTLTFAWPVDGVVERSFGEPDAEGGTLQGIAFALNKGAIRAAADGEVVYAGPFRKYGDLLIVKHGCGFQTVVSGAARLSVTIGQKVRLGEEIGTLADRPEDDQEVYFELRRDGVPADPALVMPQHGTRAPRTVTCGDVAKRDGQAQETEGTKALSSSSEPPTLARKSGAEIVWRGSFPWPARGKILQPFDAEVAEGINIAVPEGTNVKAVEKGIVIYAGDGLKALGNTVLVRHENSLVTVYGHLSELKVRRGQEVRRGEDIGKSGKSGAAPQPQLHFEVRKNSAPVDPAEYLSAP